MRKKTLWLLGISLLFLILVTVLGIVWEDAAQHIFPFSCAQSKKRLMIAPVRYDS